MNRSKKRSIGSIGTSVRRDKGIELLSSWMAFEVGTTFHSYEILDVLGAGGMGTVYAAKDRKLERRVAVKVLPDHMAGDDAFRTRFVREAKALAALSHPNILAIHDFGEASG